MSFEGKVAIVTGGSTGIGRATTLEFARQGAKVVVVADLNLEGLADTVTEAKRLNGTAESVQVDVSQSDQVEAFFDRVLKDHGVIDCAVNNAGIEGDLAPTHECSLENWNRVIAVNMTGVWLCMRKEIECMLKQGHGAIVNMSSVAGISGLPNSPAYSAAKHGVVGLTKTAALEYAKAGIRVNALCPGAIQTPLLDRIIAVAPEMEEMYIQLEPVGRLGQAHEVAAAAVWLCSDQASFITGCAMPVDGGFVAF